MTNERQCVIPACDEMKITRDGDMISITQTDQYGNKHIVAFNIEYLQKLIVRMRNVAGIDGRKSTAGNCKGIRAKLDRLYKTNRPLFEVAVGTIEALLKTAKPGEAESREAAPEDRPDSHKKQAAA